MEDQQCTINLADSCNCESTETKETTMPEAELGSLVIFNRNGKVRVAKVISAGPVNLGLNVFGMKTNTKIPSSTELVPMTVYVDPKTVEGISTGG